ncbi:M81 family metallopeptidase [Nitratireductor pacificus]|uniref:MlrC domain-containing protein n=1 Tax=Nitratireductor pacificus pht-3B TaxID=391937 RepID=K2M8P5_9HYPH|nr:M81 family metallopeptidase [Nitratireductor pacificus]EKF18516.1 MlrC domain-containing protein [Nitratireductor pacificus pht-3B]
MSKKRILLAAIFHETHSFVAQNTTFDDFAIKRGEELLQRRHDGSTISGFLEVAEAENWEVVPISDYSATPSGTIDHAVFEQFCDELEEGLVKALAEGGLDGIWLSLHGAMVTTRSVDPEGDLLARIRAVPGAETLPLFAVFDLHATMTAKMAAHANGLIGYRENPHIDSRDSAVRSARMLARSLAGNLRPKVFVRNAPIIWAPPGTGTADRPMRDLARQARALEAQNPDIWEISTVAGYAFSDVPDAGVAFSITTTAPEHEANQALDALERTAIELQEHGKPEEWDLDAALSEIKTKSGGPYIVVEPADNIGGGAPGDDTAVLRGFLKHGFTNAAVIIADADAVAALAGAKAGERRKLSIGGRGSPLGAGPLEAEVAFVSRSDGAFTLEDRNSHMVASRGIHIRMGASAVVRIEGVTVLLTSLKTSPNDLGQLRSQGIVPETLFAIGVKAAVAHRRAYDPIMAGSYTVKTAGPCTSALTTLPYRRLRQPVFPISHQRT